MCVRLANQRLLLVKCDYLEEGLKKMVQNHRRKRARLWVHAENIEETKDKQLRAFVHGRYHTFHQWELDTKTTRQADTTRLRETLEGLLPMLLMARDYTGAAKVLSSIYHRFTLMPAKCVQMSLEILRRQPQNKENLIEFYRTALEDGRLDKLFLLRELFMFHISCGEFYEAYTIYKNEIQGLHIQQDALILGTFGVLCYWLLFIESPKLRDKYRKDQEDKEETESENEDYDRRMFPQARGHDDSIESFIQTKYMFKASIGTHVLYQEATVSLRRAISISPDAIAFLEYYVQLLTIRGDIETACDYLENFYHSHKTNPHAARMMVGYLARYYPDSQEAQCDIYTRWIENDPTCLLPYERLQELVSAGIHPTAHFLATIIRALDHCGSDLFFHTSLESRRLTLFLWQQLAEFLQEDDVEFEVEQQTENNIKKMLQSRCEWWKRVFFHQPYRVEQLHYLEQRKEHTEDKKASTALLTNQLNLWIYRIFIALKMYSEKGIAQDSTEKKEILNSSMIKILHEVFETKSNLNLLKPSMESRQLFHRYFPDGLPTITTTCELKSKDKIFRGDLPPPRVLSRQLLKRDTDFGALPRIQVTLFDQDNEEDVNRIRIQIENELIAALEEDIEAGESRFEPAQPPPPPPIMADVPEYVWIIERLLYADENLSLSHLFLQVQSVLRERKASNGSEKIHIPTLLEVEVAYRVLHERWNRHIVLYGHRGLLLRYEIYIVRYLLQHHLVAQDALRSVNLDHMLISMKNHVPGNGAIHLPTKYGAWMVLKRQWTMLRRLRRRLLLTYASSARQILDKSTSQAYILDYVPILIQIVWDKCQHNGHATILGHGEIKHCVENVVVKWCLDHCQRIRVLHREMMERYLRTVRYRMPTITEEAQRLLEALQKRYRTKSSLAQVRCFIWLRDRWTLSAEQCHRRKRRRRRSTPSPATQPSILLSPTHSRTNIPMCNNYQVNSSIGFDGFLGLLAAVSDEAKDELESHHSIVYE